MAVKVASWNIEGRLTPYAKGKRGTPEQILQEIEALDADVFVLPEAYLEAPAKELDECLRGWGYELYDVPYNGDRDWSTEFMGQMPYLRVMSRLAIANVEQVSWGGRSTLVVTVIDPESQKELRVIATHLDDRSEGKRMEQLHDAVPFITQGIDSTEIIVPTVMLGDFNAMWHRGRARFIGSQAVRYVAKHLPNEALRDLAMRFTDMATGDALRVLSEKTGLRDADPRCQATTTPKMRGGLERMPSVRVAQIDHSCRPT